MQDRNQDYQKTDHSNENGTPNRAANPQQGQAKQQTADQEEGQMENGEVGRNMTDNSDNTSTQTK